MVGRRKIRGYLLDRSEPVCHGERARTLSRSNFPGLAATRVSCSRARNSCFASRSRNARNDISESLPGCVALHDAAHLAQHASERNCSPCSLPARIRLPHCKGTMRCSPQLLTTALNVSYSLDNYTCFSL